MVYGASKRISTSFGSVATTEEGILYSSAIDDSSSPFDETLVERKYLFVLLLLRDDVVACEDESTRSDVVAVDMMCASFVLLAVCCGTSGVPANRTSATNFFLLGSVLYETLNSTRVGIFCFFVFFCSLARARLVETERETRECALVVTRVSFSSSRRRRLGPRMMYVASVEREEREVRLGASSAIGPSGKISTWLSLRKTSSRRCRCREKEEEAKQTGRKRLSPRESERKPGRIADGS